MVVVFIFALLCCKPPLWAADPYFAVRDRLVHDGFEASFVSRVYQEPLVTFSPAPILINFQIRESKLNYGQFLSPTVVSQCKAYLFEHRKTLELVRKKYGAAPEIVVAVLMVESRLGNYTGSYSTLNVFSSFAAAAEPSVMKSIYRQLSPEAQKARSFKAFQSFCERKSDWAYNELKNLFAYTQSAGLPPHLVTGSVSGAVGFPQFLPSSIIKYARDGDQDGVVNLFSHPDAMVSIANFLKKHGWRENLSISEQKTVLFNYNRSTYYVEAVLALARKLKG